MHRHEFTDQPTALTIPPPTDNLPAEPTRDSFHKSLDRALTGETGWES